MNRLWTLLGIAVLAIALSACGGNEGVDKGGGAGETAEPTGAGPVTIDFWHSEQAATQDTVNRLVDRFNASQNEVRVRAAFQGIPTEAMTKLMASLGTGNVPAVMEPDTAYTQMMIDSGAVTPIQDFVDREGYDLSDLDPKSIQSFTIEGKLWAMPFCREFPLLYYNKVAFREVGLDPERPPQDLEEVRQYSEKLLKRDGAGNVVRSGIALAIENWMEGVLAEHDEFFVDNSSGHSGRATKVLFDNDTGRWFFQWWHDMVESGLAFNVGRNPSGADALLAIASGRAAMAFSWGSALRSVIDATAAMQGVEIGVGRLPGVPGGTGIEPYGAYPYGLWILNERPKEEQEAAWKFIKWLMEPEQQAEWFAGSGYLPVSRSAVELPAVQDVLAKYPLLQVAFGFYLNALNAPANPATQGSVFGPFQKVREAIWVGVEEMLSGIKDPDQALEDAASNANQAIAEYNQRVED